MWWMWWMWWIQTTLPNRQYFRGIGYILDFATAPSKVSLIHHIHHIHHIRNGD